MIFKVSIDKEKIREIGASATLLFFHRATNRHPSSHAAPTPLSRPPEKKKRSCPPGAIARPKSESITRPESESIACPKSESIARPKSESIVGPESKSISQSARVG